MGTSSSPFSTPAVARGLEDAPSPSRSKETLASLLSHIDELAAACGLDCKGSAVENRLIQSRLGLASSLFAALRAKHPPTALHSLRVAMGCASWATAMRLPAGQLDEIEIAALLHDIGKISVPDSVLTKPHKLTAEEYDLMDRHVEWGLDILGHCCASEAILDIVRFAPAWFDGSRFGFDKSGRDLPQGARMLAIVDAYDAMTTDQLYRKALSRDRALAELFQHAGTQFDPELVRSFGELSTRHEIRLQPAIARRWLAELSPEKSNSGWRLASPPDVRSTVGGENLFHQQLLNTMHDAVVFVDPTLRIVRWNRAAEQLTGISGSSVLQKRWTPSFLELHDADGKLVGDDCCPLAQSIHQQQPAMLRVSIAGRDQQRLAVDMHLAPVVARDGVVQGAAILLHDASTRVFMEERLQLLHDKASRDPLTQLANRAEFDRYLEEFVQRAHQRQMPCSLIICDIDHFKRINDTYGHQAGDEAIISFANLLKRSWRPGDLVARYGGEEFCMLCSECDNNLATERAESVRAELEQISQPMLGNQTITASFGVTEVQAGDTPETMLRRADRALLQAKESGRNTVIQLGAGLSRHDSPEARKSWLAWFAKSQPERVLERTLVTPVPLSMAVEKLRGFVADHHAEVITIEQDYVVLELNGRQVPQANRRSTDRSSPFVVELRFTEVAANNSQNKCVAGTRTQIAVTVRPMRTRDRRRADIIQRAKGVLASVSSYLMARELSNTEK